MAGIPMNWGSLSPSVYQMGLYVKFHSLPTAPTVLAELSAGSTGDAIAAWWPDGQFMVDVTVHGNHGRLSLCPSMTIHTARWYWVVIMWGKIAGGGIGYGGRVFDPSGEGDGIHELHDIAAWAGAEAATSLGWGVHFTDGYSDMPNEVGTEMTALTLEYVLDDNFNTGHLLDPPPVEPTVGPRTIALYVCHEPLGTATIIHDATDSHYDLERGPNGTVVVRDAPY